MSWLITIKRVMSRREAIRQARSVLARGNYTSYSLCYYRFGKQYSIDVRKDGRIFDSRRTLIQRFVRWLDRKDREALADMLSDRLSKNDDARRRDIEKGWRGNGVYLYRDGVCTFQRAKGLRQYESS